MTKEQLHKRSISSITDMDGDIDSLPEKKPYRDHDDEEKKLDELDELDALENEIFSDRTRKVDIFLVVITILLIGTIINFIVLSVVNKRGGIVQHQDDIKSLNKNEEEINRLLNIKNINLKDIEDNEWVKLQSEVKSEQQLDDEMKKFTLDETKSGSDGKPESQEGSHEVTMKAQKDLAEILSINSIVILTNDENTKFQTKVEKIFHNLKITPEIKFIKLNKHPNYPSILSYLKKFSHINDDDDHEAYNQDRKDIPRLFIGGLPMGNYFDLWDKYKNNELNDYLTNYGKGLIKLEI